MRALSTPLRVGSSPPRLQVALSDPYFVTRKLYPNVDFYSGIVLRALGEPRGISVEATG